MEIMSRYFKFFRAFTLQWHITERCNWSCKHCYREKESMKELPFAKLCDIFFQYLDLLKALNLPKGHSYLNFAGGEPFIRKDFFRLLEFVNKYNKGRFSVGILTNGSLVNEKNVLKLKSLGVKRVQLSLEGMRENNDNIREEGSFDEVVEKIKLLINTGIQTAISFTLTRKNMADVPAVVQLCDKLGVGKIGIRRFVPIGKGKENKLNLLSPAELRKMYHWKRKMRIELMAKHSKLHIANGCEDGIFNSALTRDMARRKVYCGVVEGRTLSLFPNGDVLACRRLPIKVGNVLQKSLLEIYFSSDTLWQLRNLNNAHSLCQRCRNFKFCHGGALCISHAYFNQFSVPDPQCWRVFKKPPLQTAFKGWPEKKNLHITTAFSSSFADEN